MLNTGKFAGKTIIISGASRGIGRVSYFRSMLISSFKAIALKFAKDKANIAILAKTTQQHAKLPGTIYSVRLICPFFMILI
jgi:citronellol/citronellal dehydrogenase